MIADDPAYLTKSATTLQLTRSDGTSLWKSPAAAVEQILHVLDFGQAGVAVIATVGRTELVQIDVATGKTIWSWSTAEGQSLGQPVLCHEEDAYRLAVFPQNSIEGIGFQFTQPDQPPQKLWHHTYEDCYWANFGPYGVAADLNNDQQLDILLAGKPSYAAAIDGLTGAILFDIHYPIPGLDHLGRPYGLIQAVDLDCDGFKDAVIASCQVEEYIAVLKNDGGTAFRLAWSHFVEQDLPHDQRELRPQVSSIADLDADGRPEIVVGLFNTTGDQQWHTVVFDALGGWQARKADLPNRFFWGCYDLDADGIAEIITSRELARRCAPSTKLYAWDLRTGRDISRLQSRAIVATNRPLPDGIGFFANRATPWFAELDDGTAGIVVRRETGSEALWHLAEGQTRLREFAPARVSRLCAESTCEPTVALHRSLELSMPPMPRTVPAATEALIASAKGRRELIVSLDNGTIQGGVPDWSRPGTLSDAWTVRGTCAAVWVSPSGERTLVAMDPERDRIYVYRPRAGGGAARPIATAELPHPLKRKPGMLLPFGNDRLFIHVTMQTGVHTVASALLNHHGQILWRDDLDGAHPRQPAIVAGADGGTQFVVDNHGKILLYDLLGRKQVVAHGWHTTIPGRSDGAKYSLPIVGPFLPDNQPGILLSPGLEQLELLDAAGARRAIASYGSIYERQLCCSSIAAIRPGAWDLGMLSQRGTFYCADAATAQTRWSLELGVRSIYPACIASGDIDGDGRDNFVLGLSDGTLLALDEQDGQGTIQWRTTLDAAVRDTRLADVDGDGAADLLVETDDGRIRVYRSAQDREFESL